MIEELTRDGIREGFRPNFFGILASPRRSGKSTLLKYLLSQMQPKRFVKVYIFSPTAHLQKDLFNFGGQIITPTKDTFGQQLRALIEYQRDRIENGKQVGEVLVIFDDVFSSSQRGFGVGAVSSALEIIGSRGRHVKIASLLLAQRITSVSPSIRSQADVLISFYPRTEAQRESLIRDFLSRENTGTRRQTRERAAAVMEEVFRESPYRALVVFPDRTGRTLEDVTRWVEAPKRQKKFTMRLAQILDEVEEGPAEEMTKASYDFMY